jgi:hypothetical protein
MERYMQTELKEFQPKLGVEYHLGELKVRTI